MKTDNTLLEEMLSDKNIMEAYKQVKRNKGAPGVDGMTVSELKGYLDENLEIIREQIRSRMYKLLMCALFLPIEVTLFCTRSESNKVCISFKRIIFRTLFCDDLPCEKKDEKDTDVTYAQSSVS